MRFIHSRALDDDDDDDDDDVVVVVVLSWNGKSIIVSGGLVVGWLVGWC